MRKWLIALIAVAAPAQEKLEALNATLWMQSSVEYRASAIQTYRAAQAALVRALADKNWTAALEQPAPFADKPPAVILDLDETVVDNSSHQVKLIKEGKTFSDATWLPWIAEARSGLIPGAAEYLDFAVASGVAPIYITNRVCAPNDPNDGTVKNIALHRLPFRADRLMCRTETGDKSPRRALAARSYRIVALIGDDINDFFPALAPVAERDMLLRRYAQFFGDRWFVLPNPQYGSWERAIGYDVKKKLEALRP